MTATALVRVGEVAEQVRGVSYGKGDATDSPEDGVLPVLRAGNITDAGVVFDDLVYVPTEKILERQLLRAGDVLIAASSGSLDVVGKAARVLADYKGAFGAFCKVLRPNTRRVDAGYFSHFFRTAQYRRIVSSLAAGANINNLRNEHLDDLLLPLPPIAEQRRIAAILDKADALRTKRREALAQLDRLAQSIFLEIFGDPQSNPKGWPVSSLSQVCSIAGEYGAGLSSRDYDPLLPRYVRITDITEQGDLSHERVSPAGVSADWAGYELLAGDILFARSGATVGKTYLYKESDGACVFAGYLIRFRPRPTSARSSYVFAFTQTAAYRAWVAARQRVVAQPNINARQFGDDLIFPIPPLDLQLDFEQKMECLTQQKVGFRRCGEEQEKLFSSLQQRAFAGQL